MDVFEGSIPEPVRLIEAKNELGCTYRDRAILAREARQRASYAKGLARDAVRLLEESTNLAKDTQPVLYADACEDLAQVFYQQQDYNYTRHWLQNAESPIPDCYKLKPNAEPGIIPLEECVEEFWQMLGKIELLRGYVAYDEGVHGDDQASRHVLEQATEHFALAWAYFGRFSGEAAGLKTTLKQLYNRFKRCRYEDLRYVQDELLLQIAETYSLDATQLRLFFRDTLGLALEEED